MKSGVFNSSQILVKNKEKDSIHTCQSQNNRDRITLTLSSRINETAPHRFSPCLPFSLRHKIDVRPFLAWSVRASDKTRRILRDWVKSCGRIVLRLLIKDLCCKNSPIQMALNLAATEAFFRLLDTPPHLSTVHRLDFSKAYLSLSECKPKRDVQKALRDMIVAFWSTSLNMDWIL